MKLKSEMLIFGMDLGKALGIDGFNVLFFGKCWDHIKNDIVAAVIDFFDKGELYQGINCTTITFIPKMSSLINTSDFRPIACCSILYKIISRILTFRFQRVIGKVVDRAQEGFILVEV